MVEHREYEFDDTRPLTVVNDEGDPMSLEDALRLRDELVAQTTGTPTGDARRDDVKAIDAAKRLGRLQAQLALIDRRAV